MSPSRDESPALPPVRPPARGELAFYAFCRVIVVGSTRAYFPGRVTGGERLPRKGAYILAPVHRSYVDWAVVARVTRRRLRYLVKGEVWKSRSMGRLLEALGAFPVRRGAADREAFGRALEVLAAGEPLVLFPEGTRRSGPLVEDLKDGAAYLALRAGVPIYPVGMAGTEQAMPRGRRLPRPTRVRLVVGEPIPAPEGSGAGHRVARSALHAHGEALAEGMQKAFDDAQALLGAPPLGSPPGAGGSRPGPLRGDSPAV